jgi:uncharacterized protein YcbK (DUF882 family)
VHIVFFLWFLEFHLSGVGFQLQGFVMDRRRFLSTAAAGLAAPAFLVRPARSWTTSERILHMWNPRTEEVYHRVYHNGVDYIPEALAEFDWFARDWRQQEAIRMSRATMDFLSLIQDEFGFDIPFVLLSGYRTRATNDMLRRLSKGVARESYHMQGKALDITHEEISLQDLTDFARDAHQGGVGVYSQSHFIHIDSARVRNWGS